VLTEDALYFFSELEEPRLVILIVFGPIIVVLFLVYQLERGRGNNEINRVRRKLSEKLTAIAQVGRPAIRRIGCGLGEQIPDRRR